MRVRSSPLHLFRIYQQSPTEQGLGAIVDPDNGEMIDEATIKIAFKLLLKGYKAGRVEESFMQKAVRSSDQTGYNFLGVELAARV